MVLTYAWTNDTFFRRIVKLTHILFFQSNPKIMKAMQECMGNPAAFAKYQNDPEVGELMNELKKYM